MGSLNNPPEPSIGITMLTKEGGIAIRILNKTGAASVKGTVVRMDSTTQNSFNLQAAQYDAIGAVYESGIADGALCWVVMMGIAEVLLEDSTASTTGNWVYASTVDGRANASLAQPAGAGFVNAEEHFKEIGHCLETKNAGTNVLCKVLMHFN